MKRSKNLWADLLSSILIKVKLRGNVLCCVKPYGNIIKASFEISLRVPGNLYVIPDKIKIATCEPRPTHKILSFKCVYTETINLLRHETKRVVLLQYPTHHQKINEKGLHELNRNHQGLPKKETR